jgi:hypothetical protein
MDNVTVHILIISQWIIKNKFIADVQTILLEKIAKFQAIKYQQQKKFHKKLTYMTINIFIMNQWNKICTVLHSICVWIIKHHQKFYKKKIPQI